ncbi:phosphomevalonate kinase [Streptomyces sp. TLI_053]|uniref:phosphomevalonate kinase n=1 Tax=Streptomyces sp. TLI_053 TaxID=1855352 RepID=UPI00087C076B|nr:phosphomevalonate kinase [Streptomyces sp. TLI_053]SDS54006.1 phosphomevalonate kinase [Streptomyces sp. TLI_053]
MTARTVTRSAPGKLFIAGEYAVLEPGHPAILAAVDRRITATVRPSAAADIEIVTSLLPAPLRLRRSDGALIPRRATTAASRAHRKVIHVVRAIQKVDELARARGLAVPPVQVELRSTLHRAGTKIGLGSSGAATVATTAAVAASYGITLTPREVFRLAMLATVINDGGSGGDVAAAVWGGWIAFRSPDRVAVARLTRQQGIEAALRLPWPGFTLRHLPAPHRLALHAGWTGNPASSDTLRERFQAFRGTPHHHRFLTRSDTLVLTAIHALQHGDEHRFLTGISALRRLLAALDHQAALGLYTPRLTVLCQSAEALGATAKPSGAGGGDCGIAFTDAGAPDDARRLHSAWQAAGIVPLSLRTAAPCPRPTTSGGPDVR